MVTREAPTPAPAAAASRLWVYTNFDCNLACTYCLSSSSPAAARRALPPAAFTRLVEEAASAGIAEFFLTGGEPLLLPEIARMLRQAATRRPTTVLTNGALLRGRRLRELVPLRHLPITLQLSLDGHVAEIHDAYRGSGSWAATVRAVREAQACGFRIAIGATETPRNAPHTQALRAFVRDLGVPDERFFLRPLTRRGLSTEGLELGPRDLAPELTVTRDGVFWHPQSAGDAMLLTREIFPLADALALLRTNLDALHGDGLQLQAYRCA